MVKNRPSKKNAIFGPFETNGRADGNQNKKAFPNEQFPPKSESRGLRCTQVQYVREFLCAASFTVSTSKMHKQFHVHKVKLHY